MDPKNVLFIVLGVVTVVFTVAWVKSLRGRFGVGPIELLIGVVTDFFDTLGVGSFATTTALFRWTKRCPDEHIPGTLNVGHTLPTILQAYIYIKLVQVESTTLIAMIVAAVVGAWCGAGFVAKLDRRRVQIGMGGALLIAGSVVAYRLLNQVGNAQGTTALSGMHLVIGVAGNFVLGVLMTIGVGLYAPCMILVALLGMENKAAFPIMMGSCAFLMPVASHPFVTKGSYSPKAALGLAIGGLPAVAIAAYVVKELDVKTMNWLVVAVVAYTAISMLSSALKKSA